MNILRFKNNDINFLARIVKQGESYGRNFSIQHEGTEPLIEIYDARFKMSDFQRDGIYLGQFISRYDVDTFEHIKTGVFLNSGSPDWSLTASNVKMLQEWASEQLLFNEKSEHQKNISNTTKPSI